ncbi:hypothetical protein E2C01_070637 [Portunus trituberculatus]|uniref:Uncharacterized protein n=1 Tax=Portunus trituberculatus TaxID=210409 RepID=A0A5B7HUP3_PORTR|nr:hypothetical protein [Portunus trituberculatus]
MDEHLQPQRDESDTLGCSSRRVKRTNCLRTQLLAFVSAERLHTNVLGCAAYRNYDILVRKTKHKRIAAHYTRQAPQAWLADRF